MNKAEAIDKVEAGNAEWCHAMAEVYMSEGPIAVGDNITSDDLWKLAGECLSVVPEERRAMGAVMRNLQKYGYIKPLQKWQPSTRACCHSRPLRVWRVL